MGKWLLGLLVVIAWSGCGAADIEEKREAKTWYRPTVGVSWQWQLQGEIDTSYDVTIYDVDLFKVSHALIQILHKQGRKVICYFSAGSYEDWRPDRTLFPPESLGKAMSEWKGERWVDIRLPAIKEIMRRRLDLAVKKGCDGVEPDNVDGFENETGFALDANEQIQYNLFLVEEAHKRGLAIGLKNDLAQVRELVDRFDFALNESCHLYDECDLLAPFINTGKAVLNVEYDDRYVTDKEKRRKMCRDAMRRHFSTLVLPRALDGSFRYSCDESLVSR